MDIDEFLDKEIQVKEEEKPALILTTNEENGAIKHYFELWNKVSDAKFKWDNNIYVELNKTTKKVKEKLDETRIKVTQLESELKQGESDIHIKRLIELFNNMTGGHGYPVEITKIKDNKYEIKTKEYIWGSPSFRLFLQEYRIDVFEFDRRTPFIRFEVWCR